MNPLRHQRPDQPVLIVGLVAIIAVYFLILVGGTVRATGAGMGCPAATTRHRLIQ